MFAVCEPSGRLVTTEFNVTVTFVPSPPGLRVPVVGDTVNHTDVLPSDQFKDAPPTFVNVKDDEAGENGPPTGPLADKICGVICKLSGTSKASTIPDVVELAGDVALWPIPRLANAAHNAARFAPPV